MTDIGAVANAVAELSETIRPFLLEWQAQKYENERKERVIKLGAAFASGDGERVHAVVDGLLHDAGTPVGLASGTDCTLDARYVEAMAANCAALICLDQQLQSLLAALKRKS